MRYKYIQRVNEEENGNEGYSSKFLSLLKSRGICDKEQIDKFLNPSINDFIDPYSIDGIKEAVNRINIAIKNQESILLFGDYDCDGICAVTILYKTLKNSVNDLYYFVPDRNSDGYGLSVAVLTKLFEKKKPNLIITVDCGITSANEVEFVKAQGIDIIITDHHEPQENLPNCIKVNPKIKRNTFYDFCGAGVALKLAEALRGRDFVTSLLDIAAIATFADIVPLTGENRVIASLGLDMMKKSPSLAVKMLIGENANSYDIMFKVAPKINSAGRIDNATKAIEMFLSDDYFIVKGIVEELNLNNYERQKKCDLVTNDAINSLKDADFDKLNFIVLKSENWDAGILGISASRLVEKYNRPTLLFSEKNGVLKGSCRSACGINIFEILKKHLNLYITFGGHSMAAGLSVLAENFDKISSLLNAELNSMDKSLFFKQANYDLPLLKNNEMLQLAKELEKLEPTGYCNAKPIFLVKGGGEFEQIGTTCHIKQKTKDYEIVGFNKFLNRYALSNDTYFTATLNRSIWQNTESAQLIIKDIFLENVTFSDEQLMVAAISGLALKKGNVKVIFQMPTPKMFGTLHVAFSKEGLSLISDNDKLPIGIVDVAVDGGQSQIVLCPSKDFDFSAFKRVVFYEQPIGGLLAKASRESEVFLIGGLEQKLPTINREILLSIFSLIKKQNGHKWREAQLKNEMAKELGISDFEFYVAIQIFSELGLITIDDKGKILVSTNKTSLDKSTTYSNIYKRINGI